MTKIGESQNDSRGREFVICIFEKLRLLSQREGVGMFKSYSILEGERDASISLIVKGNFMFLMFVNLSTPKATGGQNVNPL